MSASFSRDGQRYTVRFERRLSHPPEKVWRALTERKFIRQWFPCDIVGEWTVGAKLKFVLEGVAAVGAGEEDHHGEVLAVEPLRLLEFRWGREILRCELSPDGDGCRFLFAHSFEDKSTAARNAAGWEMCFANLDRTLSGQVPKEFEMAAWAVLFEQYVEEWAPKAGSQQGAPSPGD